jgi:hypothetical protein
MEQLRAFDPATQCARAVQEPFASENRGRRKRRVPVAPGVDGDLFGLIF